MWANHYAGFFDRLDPFGMKHEGLRSIDDVVAMLKRKNEEMDDSSTPLVAWCFDPIYYGGRRMTREDLDSVSTTRPVLVLHASLHITNVNQAFVDQVGWQEADDVVGIKRHANGTISGEMHGAANHYAMVWTMRQNRNANNAHRAEWEQYGRIATRAGVTTLTDLGATLSEKGTQILSEWSKEEDAPFRLVPALLATAIPTADGLASLKAVEGMGTDKLKLGIVKLVVDGSIQGFTGRLRWPGYANGTENGIWNVEPRIYQAALAPITMRDTRFIFIPMAMRQQPWRSTPLKRFCRATRDRTIATRCSIVRWRTRPSFAASRRSGFASTCSPITFIIGATNI